MLGFPAYWARKDRSSVRLLASRFLAGIVGSFPTRNDTLTRLRTPENDKSSAPIFFIFVGKQVQVSRILGSVFRRPILRVSILFR